MTEQFGSPKRLAILGGSPVFSKDWPKWPRAGQASQRRLLNVLHSGRWTSSGYSNYAPSLEDELTQKLTEYFCRDYGVLCSSGSSALSIALQALDIGPGDEVIVPGLTWVACASAVCHIGAIPRFADVSKTSHCIDTESIAPLLSERTRAIIVAHMYSSRADMVQLETFCRTKGVFLIEDGSQAHGASLGHRKVGSFGDISVFSFQQSKLLSSGEGGLALTSDGTLFEKMQQLRADGRLPTREASHKLNRPFFPKGDVLGRNFCMSEFHMGLLFEGLDRLEIENDYRRKHVNLLAQKVEEQQLGYIIENSEKLVGDTTFYKVPIYLTHPALITLGNGLVAKVLERELNLPIDLLDEPLNQNALYCPQNAPLLREQDLKQWAPEQFDLPYARDAFEHCIVVPHYAFLGISEDIDLIVEALLKVAMNSSTLIEQKRGAAQ